MSNSLINESSPYLLQHAHNPVNWFPWGEQALEKARAENKIILVSIGYSACHWCHVMEKESFEDNEVAQVMNEHFVCIKVDREERPDIDQVYMHAVQLMTEQGGWPLNCFTLPDGRPIYGGTYFPKQRWIKILNSVSELYKNEKEKVVDYAQRLTEGIQQSELIKTNNQAIDFSKKDLDLIFTNWSTQLDNEEGGPNRAPKFPLPNNYQFLLRYGYLSDRKNVLEHVGLTLQKMAFGGIYDQIGGGFSRYSTDELWKVPHFEKMLYDNAQLVSLYAEAHQATGISLYKQVVYETLEFIERELTSPEGFFYSALDADSEGIEGKYYVWTEKELQEVLGELYPLIADYYNVNNVGYWEHDNYILLRKFSDEELANNHKISIQELNEKIKQAKSLLLNIRSKRVHPGLDDKILTSWNALMIKGYVDAYMAFGETVFLDIAIKASENILTTIKKSDGSLWHSYKNGRATINGYLEDYAFTIEAFIALYQATFDEKWLYEANDLMKYVFDHFYDPTSNLFFFTSDKDPSLIARKKEIQDNVIPASNSSIAKSLFVLSYYFDNPDYDKICIQMLNNVKDSMCKYGYSFSNWAQLLINMAFPFYQIAITGSMAKIKMDELLKYFLPNKIIMGTIDDNSKLPMLNNKFVTDKTYIYICYNKTCTPPFSSTEEAINSIKN